MSTVAAPAAGADNFTQGLLASLQPWLTGGSPSALNQSFSKYGGTTGLLSAMLQDAPGSQGAAAFGRALQVNQDEALKRAAARQSLAQQGMGLQLFQSKLPAMMRWYGMLGRMLGGGGAPAPQPGGAPAGSPAQPGAAPGAAPGASVLPAVMAVRRAQAAQGAPAQPGAAVPASPSGGPPASPIGGSGGFWNNPLGVMRLGTVGSALGMPGGAQFMDYGKSALQYDPAIANRMAVAKNQISQDMTQLYQAYKTGDVNLIQGLTTKLKEDMGQLHVGSMSGIMTRENPDGTWTTVNPSSGLITNTKTGSTFLPGAIRAFAARAAAEAGGETGARLAAETSPVGSGGGGIPPATPAPVPGQTPAPSAPGTPAQPGPQPEGWDAVQTPGFVPALLAESGAAQLRPGNTGAEALKTFQTEQAGTANENLKTLNEGADTAQQLLTQAQQIDEAATQFSPQRFANVKGELMSALQPLGVLSKQQLQSLGSYQDASKLQIQMQTMLTRSLGSRESAQVFEKLGHSVPGLTLSPQGLTQISAYVRGIARWKIAQNTFGQRLAAQNNVEGINNLQSNFETHSNPAFYILASAPAQLRAQMIAHSPNPRALLQQWQAAAQEGLAPGPNDYEGF